MAVLLAICTFAAFILIDYLLSLRASERVTVARPAPALVQTPRSAVPEPVPAFEPVWVGGYELPEHLHYHRGHTWAKVLSPDTATVGIDDFARKFVGDVSRIELPPVGSYIRQGGTGVRLDSDGRATDLVSPIDGEVIAINADVQQNPELTARDPYGRGWLYKIRSTNLPATLRNLLSGNLARRWTEDAREQLELRLMALSGSVLQDGGEPAPDFARHVPSEEWRGLVETFFLTVGHERPSA